MDFGNNYSNVSQHNPAYEKDASELVEICKKLSLQDLGKLLHVNAKLAQLNYDRFQDFANASTKPAILAYSGDVFRQVDRNNLNNDDLSFAHEHVAIISGLYGVVKAMDFIAPYRLEMSTKLSANNCANLYSYWNKKIATYFNNAVSQQNSAKFILNLASEEYSQAVDQKQLTFPLVSIHFRQMRNKKSQNIGVLTKKARGKMLNMIIKNRIDSIENLLNFSDDGYKYTPENSNKTNLVFTTNLDNL